MKNRAFPYSKRNVLSTSPPNANLLFKNPFQQFPIALPMELPLKASLKEFPPWKGSCLRKVPSQWELKGPGRRLQPTEKAINKPWRSVVIFCLRLQGFCTGGAYNIFY